MTKDEFNETFALKIEELGRDNGNRYWSARDFMELLGYQNYDTFRKVIYKAVNIFTTINIPRLTEHFLDCKKVIDGKEQDDMRLTRLACYLIAMNGDNRKPEVAQAQAYFGYLAESIRRYQEEAEQMERVGIRSNITKHEKTLSGTAYIHGVENYAFFQNAGYRGLYNMNLKQLIHYKTKGKQIKGPLLDHMGKRELVANLFRITETEERIKNNNIRGQSNLEQAHEFVGTKVRRAMQEINGTRPEDLPLDVPIKESRKAIKSAGKKLIKVDKRGNGKNKEK